MVRETVYFMPNGPHGFARLWPEAPTRPRLSQVNGHRLGPGGLGRKGALGRYHFAQDCGFSLAHSPFAPGRGDQQDSFEIVLVAGAQSRVLRVTVPGPGTARVPQAHSLGRFGALTRAGEGALCTKDAPCGPLIDGRYGPFHVTDGMIQPAISPLPEGIHGLGPYLVEVRADTQTVGSTQEFADAIDKPSAYAAQSGGLSGLVLELRPGSYAPRGDQLHGKFQWHPGPPLTIRSADPAQRAVFGTFSIGDPHSSTDGLAQGQLRLEQVNFFAPSRTRRDVTGTNWMNQYDHYNRWNLTPKAIVNVFANGAFVEDVTFFECRFASDLPDLSTVPVPDLPLDEMGGIQVRDGRRIVIENCLFEHLYNGMGLAGEDCIARGNTQRYCHGDMLRSGAIWLSGGAELPSRRILVEHNRWYASNGDNFRHPDGIHIFSTRSAGIKGMVVRGNIFLCDAKTLAQPPKPTGLFGTLLWQAPQAGEVAPPAQNAATWLIDDQNTPGDVRLPAFRRLPICPAIVGRFGVGAETVRLARASRDWQVDDSFVFQGTRHRLVAPKGEGWTISPPLRRATQGWEDLPDVAGPRDGARLVRAAAPGDQEITLRQGYGELRPGDSFNFARINYRIDEVRGDRLRITPEIKAAQPAGTALTFNQNWSVQRLGAIGQGIRLRCAPSETAWVKNIGLGQEALSEVTLEGAWGGYLVRPDFVNGRWLLNMTAHSSYQMIFSGVDPKDGYDDMLFLANIGITPGKGLEVGYQTRPSRNNQAVNNIFLPPWPGDLDGDGRANTPADGKAIEVPVAQMSLGGLDDNIDTMRLEGNIAGITSLVTPTKRLSQAARNLELNTTVEDLNTAERSVGPFQGTQGAQLFPKIDTVVEALRPRPNGPAAGQGVGMLGTTPDGDLWDFTTGTLARTTPWEVLRLSLTPRVDGVSFTWAEPAYRQRVGLFGPEIPVTDYEVETSSGGPDAWQPGARVSHATTALRQSGQRPGDQIMARVRARNANGWGPWAVAGPVTCPPMDLGARSLDAALTYPLPRALEVPHALIVAVFYMASDQTRLAPLITPGGPVQPLSIKTEPGRNMALFLLPQSHLGTSDAVTLTPRFAGQPPRSWQVHASLAAGVDLARPRAQILTGSQRLGGTLPAGDPELLVIAVHAAQPHVLRAPDLRVLVPPPVRGWSPGLAYLVRQAGTDTKVEASIGSSWGQMGLIRLPLQPD